MSLLKRSPSLGKALFFAVGVGASFAEEDVMRSLPRQKTVRLWTKASALALLIAGSLRVAEAAQLYGAGTASCGALLEARTDGSAFDMDGWIAGFVTASGLYVSLKETDPAGLRSFMSSYCREHPTDKIADGAVALVHALRTNGER